MNTFKINQTSAHGHVWQNFEEICNESYNVEANSGLRR